MLEALEPLAPLCYSQGQLSSSIFYLLPTHQQTQIFLITLDFPWYPLAVHIDKHPIGQPQSLYI